MPAVAVGDSPLSTRLVCTLTAVQSSASRWRGTAGAAVVQAPPLPPLDRVGVEVDAEWRCLAAGAAAFGAPGVPPDPAGPPGAGDAIGPVNGDCGTGIDCAAAGVAAPALGLLGGSGSERAAARAAGGAHGGVGGASQRRAPPTAVAARASSGAHSCAVGQSGVERKADGSDRHHPPPLKRNASSLWAISPPKMLLICPLSHFCVACSVSLTRITSVPKWVP